MARCGTWDGRTCCRWEVGGGEGERERGNQVGHSRNGLAVLVRKGRAITLLLVPDRSRRTKPPHPSNPSHEPRSKAACVQTDSTVHVYEVHHSRSYSTDLTGIMVNCPERYSYTHRVDDPCLSYSHPVIHLRSRVERPIHNRDPLQAYIHKENMTSPLREEWLKAECPEDQVPISTWWCHRLP